jgi:peptidoglycan/LPS O-acetylase OafA/YrhL
MVGRIGRYYQRFNISISARLAMPFVSVDDELNRNNGIGPGFDILRFGLAVLIIFVHCFLLANGSTLILNNDTMLNAGATLVHLQTPPRNIVVYLSDLFLRKHNQDVHFADLLVPMFFALSGFLVTGSAFRTRSVRDFLLFRCLRIVPALFMEVSLSALFLGPLLTAYSLNGYFADPKFVNYFGNIIGRVRMELPGVFISNPFPSIVNGNLWTLPGEFYCYLIIAALIVTSAIFSRRLFTLLFLIAAVAFYAFNIWWSHEYSDNIQKTVLATFMFFCGSLMFQWRQYVPLNRWPMLLSIMFIYVYMVSDKATFDILRYGVPLFLTYLTIYIGFVQFPRVKLVQSGDYSYGIYLYGFPILQAIMATIVPLRGHPIYLFMVGMPMTFMLASVSWHFVEKPTLSLKKYVGGKKARITSALISR